MSASFSVGPDEERVSASVRRSLGLSMWVDGPLGVERDGSEFAFYGANGPEVARSTGPLHYPAAAAKPQITISGARDLTDVGYAAGGPIHVADPGLRLLFVHVERYPNPQDMMRWYASVGLARSTDAGQTWEFLGEIMCHNLSYEAHTASQPAGPVVQTYDGQHVIQRVDGQDYFYVFGLDVQQPTPQGQCAIPFAVARAPVAEVLDAARSGSVSAWSKYHQGAFSEPGLGGRASETLPPSEPLAKIGPRGQFDITHNTHRDRLVMALARPVTTGLYGLDLLESADGLTWSAPQRAFVSTGEIYAPTIVSADGNSSRKTGAEFYVYYDNSLAATTGGARARWGDATLRWRRIRYS